MKTMERNVMRLVAVQHLRTFYGIKTKNWNKNQTASCKSAANNSAKVFGVPLERLPYYNMECGSVSSFVVDACMKLMAHVDTEGLFRKSGSIVRLKALRAKLDVGEECLSAALPCDVAGLVKQFFRELPEPVLPTELQEAFLKAQQLPTAEERTSATMLLSCVLPDRNLNVLRHFLDFLHNVSKRSAENKMDSSNLSVILAPNLFHSGDGTEKMNASTEKRLRLQTAVVHCFIEHAHNFGVLPQFLQEKVPAMMGCEPAVLSPTHDELRELDLNSGVKRRHRRSFGVFSSATPVIATPTSKRKLPLESGHTFGFSNKKRRSVKKSFGIELLPNMLFSGTSTPGSAYNASGVLDSSQSTASSAGRSLRKPATSARRKSRRLSNRHVVNRVESGKAGCFSPKVGKKEAPRKSLRLRFSLGRSNKDAGSESIGWRLATQESTASFCFTKETVFSPSALPRNTEPESESLKYISKSEDNLLTPQYDSSVHQISWSGATPVGAQVFSRGSFTDTPMNMCLKNNYLSEPTIPTSKPPAASGLPKKLCCASSAESLESGSSITEAVSQTKPTLLKIKSAFTESDSNIRASVQDSSAGATSTRPSGSILLAPPETPTATHVSVETLASSHPAQQSFLAKEQNITFGQIELAALSPLHIDSVVFEHESSMVGEGEEEAEQMNYSRLIDALDIQSPTHFKLGPPSGLQSTPYKPGFELNHELGTPSGVGNIVCMIREDHESSTEIATKVQNQQPLSPHSLETKMPRVTDHIQYFNKLTIYSPGCSKAQQSRSLLRFQRTPVRQTVHRINSLLGESRRPTRHLEVTVSQSGHVVKSVTQESGLSPQPQRQPHQGESQVGLLNSVCPVKKPPPVPPKKPSTLARKSMACALGDVTNKVQPKTKEDSDPSVAERPCVQQAVKDIRHYRGSPRNPFSQTPLLSATKPVDL
ncbi:hypothetical protein PAMA_003690 [Pampus argenteus]